MHKTGKDLKLGDTLYYVDTENFIIVEYMIEGMVLCNGNVYPSTDKSKWNGIRLDFGTKWEKKPTILMDGKVGRNGFEIYIDKDDAIELLYETIDKAINRSKIETERLYKIKKNI